MEKLAQNLIATLRESLLVLDYDLRVQVANRAFYRTFQVEADEVQNCHLYELGNGQWNIPGLRAAIDAVMTCDTPVEDFAVEHHFPQIGRKVMLINARRVERDESAEPLILMAIDDVTEQHQATQTIERYLHRLQLSNRELEDFASIASHDLQEPLRAIQAFSDRLHSRYTSVLDEQGLDYLVRIQKAAGRMRHLITDLLLYSRVTTQGNPFESVDLTKVAEECVADLALRLEDTGGSIQIGDLPCLEADPTQMRQLMQNLFDNGLKFHREGQAPRVEVQLCSADNQEWALPLGSDADTEYFCLLVRDNGVGFETKYAERIFTPFERLHAQTRYPGTGIGLAVCRRIVERHGGALNARSAPDQGATFFIVLPRQQPKITLQTNALQAAEEIR